MPDDSTQKLTAQQKRARELENKRDQWKQDYEQATKDKIALGYGDVAEEEFIKLSSNEKKGQVEMSKIIALQDNFRRLDEERKSLWPEEAIVEKMNEKLAVVCTKGGTFYLTEKYDYELERDSFVLDKKQSMKDFYVNKRATCSDGTRKSVFDIWDQHENRREFPGGIVCDTRRVGNHNGTYNLYTGYTKEPKQGDSSRYWDFVFEIVCAGDEKLYNYVRKWISYVFRFPQRLHTALVIQGEPGAGKGTFVHPFGILFGKHFNQCNTPHELLSHFNWHLAYTILVEANEAVLGGDKKTSQHIKAQITEPFINVEQKGRDIQQMRNLKHFVFLSNDNHPVDIDPGDRRFVTMKISRKRVGDHAWWEEFYKFLDTESVLPAILFDILNENLDGFNPKVLPNPEASFAIKLRSANSVARYLYEVLTVGCFDVGNGAPNEAWIDFPKSKIFSDYQTWCVNNGEKQVYKNCFSEEMKEIIPSITNGGQSRDYDRKRIYSIPPLEKARAEFQARFKADSEIWN